MSTLLEDLIPTIDDARQVATDLGVRLYRAFVRVSTWSGASPYDGARSDSDTELLPRPKLGADGPVFDQKTTESGLLVGGTLRLSRISAQIPLSVLQPVLAVNQRVYIVILAADGAELAETLWVLEGGPFRKTTEWVLRIRKVEG
jgi:hypothetical protein